MRGACPSLHGTSALTRSKLRFCKPLSIKTPMSAPGPGCVKTCMSRECAELFSLFPSFDGVCQSYSFLIHRNRDRLSTRKSDVGVFTQPGSKPVLTTPKRDFRSTPNNGHHQTGTVAPFSANFGSRQLLAPGPRPIKRMGCGAARDGISLRR